MKLMCIGLSFVLLLTGCFSDTVITKEDVPALDKKEEVTVHLIDSTYIITHDYTRIDSGYVITGRLAIDHAKEIEQNPYYNPFRENLNSTDFSGVVLDNRIKEITIREYDRGMTIRAVKEAATAGIILIGFIMVATSLGSHGLDTR